MQQTATLSQHVSVHAPPPAAGLRTLAATTVLMHGTLLRMRKTNDMLHAVISTADLVHCVASSL
jgi:hypothetical protein